MIGIAAGKAITAETIASSAEAANSAKASMGKGARLAQSQQNSDADHCYL
jgi:hypothetical protein